jgi:hypothetical protein
MPRKKNPTPFEKGLTIRTTRKAQRALDRVVNAVKASERVRWKGDESKGDPSKEAIVNAVWLWVADMDEDAVIDAMAVYVPKLWAILTAEAAAARGGKVPAPSNDAAGGNRGRVVENPPGRSRKVGG